MPRIDALPRHRSSSSESSESSDSSDSSSLSKSKSSKSSSSSDKIDSTSNSSSSDISSERESAAKKPPRMSTRHEQDRQAGTTDAKKSLALRNNDTVVTMPSALAEDDTDASSTSHDEPNLRSYSGDDAANDAQASERLVSSNWVTLGAAIGGSAAVGVLFGKMFHWHETEKVAAIIGASTALGIAVWGLAKTVVVCRNRCNTQPST